VAQYEALGAARRREFAWKWGVNRTLRALVGSPVGVSVAARVANCWNLPIRSLVAIAGDVSIARDHDVRRRSNRTSPA
jgi:hypothetical protein